MTKLQFLNINILTQVYLNVANQHGTQLLKDRGKD